jgi:hypothetical protein
MYYRFLIKNKLNIGITNITNIGITNPLQKKYVKENNREKNRETNHF